MQLYSLSEAGHRISDLDYKPNHDYRLEKTNFWNKSTQKKDDKVQSYIFA